MATPRQCGMWSVERLTVCHVDTDTNTDTFTDTNTYTSTDTDTDTVQWYCVHNGRAVALLTY